MNLYSGYDNYSDQDLLALAIWREARNQPHEAKLGVGMSIRNRVQHPRWWGRTYNQVILDKWQFSSFDPSDPNSNKFPSPDLDWNAYLDAEDCATSVLAGAADNTQGAVSYFDRSLDSHPPAWASSPQFQHSADIGNFHFYALATHAQPATV